MELFNNIKFYHVTIAEIAKKSGFSQQYVSEVLRGTRNNAQIISCAETMLEQRKSELRNALANETTGGNGFFNKFLK